MIDNLNFAAKIAAARKEKGFTQEELSDRMGVSAQAVSKWERGLNLPDIDLLLDLSRILELSLDYLFDKEQDNLKTSHKTAQEQAYTRVLADYHMDEILFTVGYGYIKWIDEAAISKVVDMRRSLYLQTGVLLPVVRIKDDINLAENEYEIKLFGQSVVKTVTDNPDEHSFDGILTELTGLIRNNLRRFVNRHTVKLMVEKIREETPFLIEGVIPERFTLSMLTNVVKKLIDGGYSVYNLAHIVNVIDEYIDSTTDAQKLSDFASAGLQKL